MTKEPIIIEVNRPEILTDDRNSAVFSRNPEAGSYLLSLPQYAGEQPSICVFDIPGIGVVKVPGLNNPLFNTRSIPGYSQDGRYIGYQVARLPSMYVFLNRALQAPGELAVNRRKSIFDSEDENNFTPIISDQQMESRKKQICFEFLTLSARLLETSALRSREGFGFMALAQANPLLTQVEVGLGLGLASELLKDVKRLEMIQHGFDPHDHESIAKYADRVAHGKIEPRFNVPEDLAGLKLDTLVRFPATTSKSVRLDMHLVICGRGRCVYLNPIVLKKHMEGDVDGDQVFGEINSYLRTMGNSRKFVSLADHVTSNNYIQDYELGSIAALPEKDDFELFYGMDGKNGIGEATNFAYRGMIVQNVVYSRSSELRENYWQMIERPDIRDRMVTAGLSEVEQQSIFRHLSARCLMDGIHPIYEGIFDLRKDDTIADYLTHFLGAIRGHHEMNFDYLSEMKFKGNPIDVRPLQIVWYAATLSRDPGRLTQFVNQYPIMALFFSGKGQSPRKNSAMKKILQEVNATDMAQFIIEELNGDHYTRVSQDYESVF